MINKYDELLIEGLSKLKELEFSNIPDAKEIEYTFSDEYIKAKDKLLIKLGHSYWKYVNTIAKKVAVIAITLLVTFTSLMTVDAFREKVVEFVYKIYDTFTEIHSLKNTNYDTRKSYTLNIIPSGYSYKFSNNYQELKTIIWSNSQNFIISLTQANLLEFHQFNSEHGELYETIINNTPCLVCVDTDLYYCYWEFDGYRFELIYPVDLGEEFMSEVVGNLVEIDPAKPEN